MTRGAGTEDPIDPEPVVVVAAPTVEGAPFVYTIEIHSCCAGETMYVRVTSGAVTIDIARQDGEILEQGVSEATIELVEEGPLSVLVTSEGGPTDYELEVGIAVNAS